MITTLHTARFAAFGLISAVLMSCGSQTDTSNTALPSSTALLTTASVTELPLDQVKSFEVTTPGFTNRSIRHKDSLGYTEVVDSSSNELLRKDASWKIVRGLADANCYSLQSQNYPDRYLRHAYSRVRTDTSNGSDTFKADATWCAKAGLSGTGVSLESKNFPGSYLRHANGELWLAQRGNSGSSFDQDASWNVVAAWSGTSGGNGGGCAATEWTRGVNYALGTLVRFPGNGQYYKVINVGANGSDGTDPTVSGWYWGAATCDTGNIGNPPPPPPPPPAGGDFVVSEAQYNQMFPNRVPYYNYAGLKAAISAYPGFAKTGSDTVQRQEAAALLANMHHESGGGQYIREINQANWPLYCGSGNCGGKQYYGRGPIQLSWDFNYKAAGDALGIDLLNNPELVATDASVGWKTAIWYWMTQRAQAAKTPHDSMVSSAGFGETIRAINGGLECNGAGEVQRNTRITLYRNFTGVLGADPGNNLGC